MGNTKEGNSPAVKFGALVMVQAFLSLIIYTLSSWAIVHMERAVTLMSDEQLAARAGNSEHLTVLEKWQGDGAAVVVYGARDMGEFMSFHPWAFIIILSLNLAAFSFYLLSDIFVLPRRRTKLPSAKLV